jgi:hypothetical protein
MVYTHRDYDYEDGTQAVTQPSNGHIPVHAAECAQPLFHDSPQQPPNACDWSLNQTVQAYQHHSLAANLSSQRQSSALGTSHADFASSYPDMHQTYALSSNSVIYVPVEMTLQGQHDLMHLQMSTNSSTPPPTHPSFSNTSNSADSFHHHNHHYRHLPRRHTLSVFDGTYHDSSLYSAEKHFPSSVVRDPDTPKPEARPTGPKLKFTPEDDAFLVELKEKKDLTWKQIADFFPGRSSGTLQVRYCTKLKAKEKHWTEPLVSH